MLIVSSELQMEKSWLESAKVLLWWSSDGPHLRIRHDSSAASLPEDHRV